MTNQVPVRLLNPKSEPITVYSGTEIATLEGVEVSTESVNVVDNVDTPQHKEQKQDLLQKLLERMGPGLAPCEKEPFFTFLTLMPIFC